MTNKTLHFFAKEMVDLRTSAVHDFDGCRLHPFGISDKVHGDKSAAAGSNNRKNTGHLYSQ